MPTISTLVLGADPSSPWCALPRPPAGGVVPVVRSLCPLVSDQRRRLFARSSLAVLDDHPARRLLGSHAGARPRPSHRLSLAWAWLRARSAGSLAPPHSDRPGPQTRDARAPRACRSGLGIRDQGRVDPLARLHAAASTLTRRARPRPRLQRAAAMVGRRVNVGRSGVLAPFAVDQAADLCSCGHENDDSAAGLVCMSWTATGTRTTATWNA